MAASNGPDSLRVFTHPVYLPGQLPTFRSHTLTLAKKMLLGKRPRPPIMKRTKSVSGMSVDMQVSNVEAQEGSDPNAIMAMAQSMNHDDPFLQANMDMVSPRTRTNPIQNHRTNSAHVIETAHFLRTCGLCKRRLAPGRDIYMYRGDTAFCSLECREQQMKQDERKDKWKVTSSKKEDPQALPATASSKASNKSETIAAA